MNSRIFISLLLFLPMVMQAQVERDARSWLSDMDMPQIEKEPSMNLRNYEYSNRILQPSIPSLSFQDKFEPLFNSKQLQLKKPYKLFKSMEQAIWKPNNKLSIEGENIRFQNTSAFTPRNLTGINTKASYNITNRLSANIYGYYIANDYKNLTIMQSTLFRSEIGTDLSYNITKNLKIKTGMQYQYNTITRRWEYMFRTGIALLF